MVSSGLKVREAITPKEAGCFPVKHKQNIQANYNWQNHQSKYLYDFSLEQVEGTVI